jgi:hypothetical protein
MSIHPSLRAYTEAAALPQLSGAFQGEIRSADFRSAGVVVEDRSTDGSGTAVEPLVLVLGIDLAVLKAATTEWPSADCGI